MILIACTDDGSLNHIASDSILANPLVFNRRYRAFRDVVPMLGAQENLFILAHGAFQSPDDGRPVIGDQDEQRAFCMDGRTCYYNILSIIPANYAGGIYVDACFSANNSPDIDSFITTLQQQFLNNGLNIAVYGVNGESSGLIVPPGDPKWIRAE